MMKNICTVDQIVRNFRLEAKEDYVGLWQIVSAVTYNLQLSDPVDIRRVTMDVVQDLLKLDLCPVDLIQGGGCIPWSDQRFDTVITRINEKWNALGKEPDIGDVVWFDAE